MNASSRWMRAALVLALGGCQTVRTEDVRPAAKSCFCDLLDPAPRRRDTLDLLLVVSNAPGTGDLHQDLAAGDPPDWDTGRVSLQYACTFPLLSERVERYRPGADFACADGSHAPLCDRPSPATQRTRVRGRAFPSPRPLWLARELGAQARIASACPRVTAAGGDVRDGFAPSLGGFARAVGGALVKK